jgi:hypothetical protein
MFQKNMENVSLSIKEEIADETKYGGSNLHHEIGVLEEDYSQVNVRQIRSTFRFFFYIVSFAISQSFCRFVRCLAKCS